MTNDVHLGLQSSDEIDTTVSHSARVWDYWLDGKEHYPVDQEVGDRITEFLPDAGRQARAARVFLGRVVRFLAGEAGVRQFLDVGPGLPTVDNTHEVAQRAAPDARVVYADNDPLVVAHARALLTGGPAGATHCVEADLREPATIIRGARGPLDLTRPVAVILCCVLCHLLDDEAYAAIEELTAALAPGSYVALADVTMVVSRDRMTGARRYWNRHGAPPVAVRSPAQLAWFLRGLDLVAPGLVTCTRWRPEADPFGVPEAIDLYGGVGRKP